MQRIKILNLYSGIGGNRLEIEQVAKKYDINIEVTAVEYDEKIANI